MTPAETMGTALAGISGLLAAQAAALELLLIGADVSPEMRSHFDEVARKAAELASVIHRSIDAGA